MIVKDTLLKVYNQLAQLDPNKSSLVTYNSVWNYFNYIQDSKTITLTATADIVIPPRNFKYMLLTPNGYYELMTKLQTMISDNNMIEDKILIVPKKLGFEVYQARTSRLFPYPVRVASIKLGDITNRMVITIMYRILYKKFNNPLTAVKRALKASKKVS